MIISSINISFHLQWPKSLRARARRRREAKRVMAMTTGGGNTLKMATRAKTQLSVIRIKANGKDEKNYWILSDTLSKMLQTEGCSKSIKHQDWMIISKFCIMLILIYVLLWRDLWKDKKKSHNWIDEHFDWLFQQLMRLAYACVIHLAGTVKEVSVLLVVFFIGIREKLERWVHPWSWSDIH